MQAKDVLFCAKQSESRDCRRRIVRLVYSNVSSSPAVTVATATMRSNVDRLVACKLYFAGKLGATGANGRRG